MIEEGFISATDPFFATLDEVAEIIYNDNRIKGFYDDTPAMVGVVNGRDDYQSAMRIYLGNKLMLVVGEIAEAHEAIRKGIDKSEHIPEFTAMEEEVADTIIRLLDFAGYNKLRLAQAIKAKLIYNQSRPYRHGKKF